MISLYVHVPFCAARCPYCDFATAPARSPLRARYLAALEREVRLQGAALGRPRVRTLYFGGGTPSLLEPAEFGALAASLADAFELRPEEVTLEANPATLAPERLRAFVRGGVTRMSLGAQSLDPRGLRALARTHRVEDVAASVRAAREAGVGNVSLDLIFGWPGQDEAGWRADLERALALGPDHLSCYPLTLELEPEASVANWPGGGWRTLERWRSAAAAAQPDDDRIALMYAAAERVLGAAGLEHYEIANWARPRRRCRHNLAYWRDEEWLGVGLGAHSHLAGRRFWQPARLEGYVALWEGSAAGATAWAAAEREGRAVAAEPWEAAMLALRLGEGLRYRTFTKRFGGSELDGVLSRLRELDGARLVRWRRDGVALSRRGRLLSNEVFARLLPDRA